jgi:hypothetical protein
MSLLFKGHYVKIFQAKSYVFLHAKACVLPCRKYHRETYFFQWIIQEPVSVSH